MLAGSLNMNSVQFANLFLFKCLTEGQDRIHMVLNPSAQLGAQIFLQSFCVFHSSMCDYKKGLFTKIKVV